MSNGDRVESTGGRTNAIIAALAAVLAAVIVAAGGIIAATIRAKHEAQDESSKLRQQLASKTNENESLQAKVISLQGGSKNTVTPSPSGMETQEVEGFAFSRPECVRASLLVTCKFKVTNTGGARRLRPHARPDLFHNSRALTDQGPLVQSDGAVLAGVEGPLPELDVPSRVTIPASVKFRDVPPDVATFTVLTIGFEINIDDHEVEFRDVQIAQTH
jgi:hypothetical protein